ncbi:MAG: hypothetical protein H7320_03170 [Ferruginibacter sp.]|nr:hypothetical protein [Ferruginibacter sp.]
MKIYIIIAAGIMAIIAATAFTHKQPVATGDEPKYYVTTAWEVMNTSGLSQPLVTNVVYADCEYHSTGKVANQLLEYYNAYHKASRKSIILNRIISWRYDTKDGAEKKRRELIAAYNNQHWETFLIEKFSVLCN